LLFLSVREAQKLGNPKHTEGVGEQAAKNNVWSCKRRSGGWRNCTLRNFTPSTLHLFLLLLSLYQLE